MTMVLAAMTDDHVFVVSDRRMTNARTGSLMSSTENKAVVLNGEMILTYTGFCDLDGLPTDAWVADVLANAPVETWLRILLNRVGPAVRRIRVRPELQRHAFLLTGYDKTNKVRRPFRPVGFLISNFHGPDGRVLRKPESKFWLSILRLGNWKVRVDSIGRELPDPVRAAIEKAIRVQMRATPDRPQRVLDILGGIIRKVAERDAGVGHDLMAVSFPLRAIGSGMGAVSDPTAADWREQLVALYAGMDSGSVIYAPAFVRPGLQVLGMSVSNDPTNSPAALHRIIQR
jgi:hypothetical protein